MPSLPAVPGVVRVDIGQNVGNDGVTATGLYFAYSGSAPSAVALAALAAAIDSWCKVNLPPIMPVSGAYRSTTVTDLSSSSAAQGYASTPTGGSRAGGSLPASIATLINYTIARRYRGGKPRSYFPWGTDGDIASPQAWSSAYQTAVVSKVEALIAAIIAASPSGITLTHQVNISYYSGYTNVAYGSPVKYRRVPTPRAVPLVDQITSLSMNLRPGSARNRLKL